jgi:hypothetical protein
VGKDHISNFWHPPHLLAGRQVASEVFRFGVDFQLRTEDLLVVGEHRPMLLEQRIMKGGQKRKAMLTRTQDIVLGTKNQNLVRKALRCMY